MFNLSQLTPEIYKESEAKYTEILKVHQNWHEIPFLDHGNLHEFPDGSLIRFRGMLQDMLDNEIYLQKCEVKSENSIRIQDGRYYDYLPIKPEETVDFESCSNVRGERRTLFVISVPGINTWTTEHENRVKKNKAREVSPITQEMPSGSGCKRCADDDSIKRMELINNSDQKKIKIEQEKSSKSASDSLFSSEFIVNSPIPDRASRACLTKIYSDFEGYQLNSVIDIVGFLSVNPLLDGSATELSDFDDPMEHQASNPPPSLIPRIHAIAVRKLKHINPLMDVSFGNGNTENLDFTFVRGELITILTQCLFGDVIAAEYLLAHLISTIYSRIDTQAFGQFSLNISRIPKSVLPGYTTALYEILESLLPASHYFPMTLNNMNTMNFIPKKDYNTNKLVSGLLQLAPHTHLVLDETRLETGKLETNGVLGVQSFAYLIQMQQIRCNFQFYEIDYDTNIPVLTLSEGKSMLPSDYHIPLHPNPECVEFILETIKAATYYLKPKLDLFRRYLTNARICDYNLTSFNTEIVHNDFVEMRKADKTVGADHLHCLLVLSRLLGISNGKNSLDKSTWEAARNLELQRRKRIDH